MESVGIFSTIPLTVAILSPETIGFLPFLGCSKVVPVLMKLWVNLEITRGDGVFLGAEYRVVYALCIDDRFRLKVKLDHLSFLLAAQPNHLQK